MATLSEPQKLFVVQQLACFYTPSEVRDQLQESWGTTVELAQLARYNPLTIAGRALSKSLVRVFEAAREAFVSDRSGIAIAQANYRLRELDELYRQAKAKRNFRAAADLLEQAAMDEGGKFTNKREISGPGGKPMEVTATARDAAGPELEAWRKARVAELGDLMTPPTE